jgi:poly(3-hydroxybutyrate) depolymerase
MMKARSPWLASLAAAHGPSWGLRRPEIGLDHTAIGARRVAVQERSLVEKPFCRLVHFERDVVRNDPRVLVVAPLSGHFSALLRDLLAALLPDHDLHLADWIDAREVPLREGGFGIEENIGYLIEFARHLGGGLHLLALCQSAMPALAATALIAQRGDVPQPRTLTLINGMIDPRIDPTRIDRLAARRSSSWFESRVIAAVPGVYPGQGRAVYPAEVQRAALLAYLARHIASGGELLGKLLHDDGEDAAEHPFLKLYLAVMDLSAAFFLDTVRLVFHEFALPRGRLTWRGERVEPAAIAKTGLMTVEGEHDDVSAPGQTRVAHALCCNIPAQRRLHYLQPGVAHFGTFHGRAWRNEVMPRIRGFIRATE